MVLSGHDNGFLQAGFRSASWQGYEGLMLKMCRGRSRLLISLICVTLCSACESVKVKETPAEEPVPEIVEVVYTPLPDVPDSQRYAEALKLLEYGEG